MKKPIYNEKQTRRTIRHCERWMRTLDAGVMVTVLTMVTAGVIYWATNSSSLRSIELIFVWIGLAIISILLMVELAVTSALNIARKDLEAGGEEGFDEHVNRLIDKREQRNEIKKRLMK